MGWALFVCLCWVFFFVNRRQTGQRRQAGRELNGRNSSTHSTLACLIEGCGDSRPPSVSQISAEVVPSRLRWSPCIPQRAAHGDAHGLPAAGSKKEIYKSRDFCSNDCGKTNKQTNTHQSHLNDRYLINSARRQTRQTRRHRTRRSFLPLRDASNQYAIM